MEELHSKPQLSLFGGPRPVKTRIYPAFFKKPMRSKEPTCLYLGYRTLQEGLEVRLFFKWDEGKDFTAQGGRFHGAFKGLHRVRHSHSALLRWLWADLHDDTHWPARLLRRTAPRSFLIPWPHRFDEAKRALTLLHLELCLAGLKPLPELVLPHEEPDIFLQKLWMRDQISLSAFFSSTACRLRRDPFQDVALSRSQRRAKGLEKLEATQHCFPDFDLEIKCM